MKRMIKSSNDIELTSRQAKKARQLMEAYRELFDLLDDAEFNEDGEFFPLINNPDIADEISDEMHFLSIRMQ